MTNTTHTIKKTARDLGIAIDKIASPGGALGPLRCFNVDDADAAQELASALRSFGWSVEATVFSMCTNILVQTTLAA